MARAEIHLISDGKLPLSQFIKKAVAVHPLLDYIHLREKHLSAQELVSAAQEMLHAGIPADTLIINDRIDVALAVGAGGVQLAWHSLSPVEARGIAPYLLLGRSIHSPAEGDEASTQGAHFCLFGHVFPSTSKLGQPERGLEMLAETVRISRIPVIAIGGITPENASQVMKQGAAGIAVMSGICSAEDPMYAVKAYRTSLQKLEESKQTKEVRGMNLLINGTASEYTEGCRTLADLMNRPEWFRRLTIVELNGEIVSRENYESTSLFDGDRIEIVQFVGGG